MVKLLLSFLQLIAIQMGAKINAGVFPVGPARPRPAIQAEQRTKAHF